MLTEREEAYRVLLLWQKDGSFIKESGLSPFAMELALGVCRRHLYLEYFVKSLTKKLPSLEARVILEMGLFQMFFMDVPDYAAINASVELAKSANLGESTARLVNAVLRTARRQGEPALPPQRVRRVSVENSVPEWLVRRWFDVYGGDRAEALAKATLERPTEWIRVNLQKTSAPVLAEKIGITGASILYDRFIEIPRDVGVKLLLALPEFVKGEFSFQNPSAFEVVKLLDLKPGLKVWDACAAPGGKTALMAEMDSSLEILASDSSASRLEKMQDLMNRLGLTNIKTEVIDLAPAQDSATSPQHYPLSSEAKFDRILLDVPCSGFGLFSDKPDLRYNKSLSDIVSLSETQSRILFSCCDYVKPGGKLVYSTCTISKRENENQIGHFLNSRPDYTLLEQKQFLPMVDGIDGFYYAVMKRS